MSESLNENVFLMYIHHYYTRDVKILCAFPNAAIARVACRKCP